MRIKHFTETKEMRFSTESGRRENFPVLTPSGTAGITVEGTEYWADDEGWFDVPDEVGARYIGTPGWREDIGCPFEGEVVPEPPVAVAKKAEAPPKKAAAVKKAAAK